MMAREKFNIGDRVRLTVLARDRGIRCFATQGSHGPQVATGTVTGFGRGPNVVSVHPDGSKSAKTYYMDFWEKLEVSREAN